MNRYDICRFLLSRFFYFKFKGKFTIIKRVLNHNAVIAQNNKNVDILLFGKGIAFGKKVGDAIPPSSIEKVFCSRIAII